MIHFSYKIRGRKDDGKPELFDDKRNYTIEDGKSIPELLRALAKHAIEEAERMDEIVGRKVPDRYPFNDTVAVLIDRDILSYRNVDMCNTAEATRGYNEAMKRVREFIGMED